MQTANRLFCVDFGGTIAIAHFLSALTTRL
jgi:hypothetical protein